MGEIKGYLTKRDFRTDYYDSETVSCLFMAWLMLNGKSGCYLPALICALILCVLALFYWRRGKESSTCIFNFIDDVPDAGEQKIKMTIKTDEDQNSITVRLYPDDEEANNG